MLQWNELHPYNAVHVVRLPAALELDRLKATISTTLEAHGLTGLELDRTSGEYQYHGGAATLELKVGSLRGGRPELIHEITAQLNTPFPNEPVFSPFRFFVIRETESLALGLVYFHALADAESIVRLLKDVVAAYLGRKKVAVAKPFEVHPSSGSRSRHPTVLARKLARLPSLVRALRKTCRPIYRNASDLRNQFDLFTVDAETLGGMSEAAGTLGITLNDLFLARLMYALAGLDPERSRARRRPGITVGCVVNTRKDLGLHDGRRFGVYLGHFIVHHSMPPGITFRTLAKDIGRQTSAIKRARLYLGAGLEISLGGFLMSLFSPERRRKLYQKHYPLWGGLSNMDLNPLWLVKETPRPIQYFRAVSTGPVTPLVLSITTMGSEASFGLAYRPTVFSPGDIQRIRDCFLDSVSHPVANL